MTQSRKDNDVIDHTGVVYANNRTELSWSIREREQYMMKIKQHNDMIDHTGAVYAENETELSADLKGCSL